MKKSLVKLLGIVLCIGLLTGCGKEQEVVQRNVATEESRQTEELETKTVEDEQAQSVDEEQSTEENDDSEQASNQDESDTTFHIDDTVIFDEEGVTVTLKDFRYDSDYYYYTVNVDNNNPDNRQVIFICNDVSINRFSAGGMGSCPQMYILAGDSMEDQGSFREKEYRKVLEMYGETLDTFPVEILGYYYSIQIGSDSEERHGHTFIKTSNYKDGNLDKLYGDKILEEHIVFENSEYQDGMYDVSVYLRDGIDVRYITVLNSGDFEWNLYKPFVVVNGEDVYGLEIYGGRLDWMFYAGEGMLFRIDTPENICRNMEIPNDELLDVSLQFSVSDSYNYNPYEINIPISIE